MENCSEYIVAQSNDYQGRVTSAPGPPLSVTTHRRPQRLCLQQRKDRPVVSRHVQGRSGGLAVARGPINTPMRRGSTVERDKELQRFPSPDCKRWIELRERPDGLFYFQESYEPIVGPADELWMISQLPSYGSLSRDGDLAFTNASRMHNAILKR